MIFRQDTHTDTHTFSRKKVHANRGTFEANHRKNTLRRGRRNKREGGILNNEFQIQP